MLFLNTSLYAQREGEYYLGIMGGYEKNGYLLDIHLEYNNYSDGIFKIGAMFQPEEYKFLEKKIPVKLYLGQLNYSQKLISLDYEDKYVFRYGGGLTIGWEDVNSGKKYISSGYELTQKSKILYGINAGVEFESYLFNFGHMTSEVFLTLQINYNYFFNSDIGSRQPTFKTGFKFNIF